MDCLQFRSANTSGQADCVPQGATRTEADGVRQTAGRPFGSRQCLLKGCERWFQPKCPQSRYCGPECQQAACRWRRWLASRKYRNSEHGRACRREQACRRRAREKERPREPARTPPPEVVADTTGEGGFSEVREGQRAAQIPKRNRTRPCRRPGCYEEFVVRPDSPPRSFCCAACRKALRRVLIRERRWRERRQQGIGPRRCPTRGPP